MLKHRAQRLARRLLILSVLAAVPLATSTPVGRKAAAAIPPVPCAFCENMFNNCLANCGTLGSTSACHKACADRYNNCLSTCT